MSGDLQDQKSPKHSCFTRACPSTSDSSQTWEPGTHCTAWRQVMKLEGALSGCFSWCKCLVGSNHGSASSRHLVWYQSLPCSLACLRVFFAAFIVFPGIEGPSDSGWFQGLPEAVVNCLASWRLLSRMASFLLRGTLYDTCHSKAPSQSGAEQSPLGTAA